MIVVIEDKRIFLDEWREVLSKEGVPFHLFCHPLEFLAYCEKHPEVLVQADILVTDQKTPGFDVLETDFLNALRAKYPQFEAIGLICSSLFDPKSEMLRNYGYAGAIPKKAFKFADLMAQFGDEPW